MDRLNLSNPEWDALHDDLMVLEDAAMATMQEFARKPE